MGRWSFQVLESKILGALVTNFPAFLENRCSDMLPMSELGMSNWGVDPAHLVAAGWALEYLLRPLCMCWTLGELCLNWDMVRAQSVIRSRYLVQKVHSVWPEHHRAEDPCWRIPFCSKTVENGNLNVKIISIWLSPPWNFQVLHSLLVYALSVDDKQILPVRGHHHTKHLMWKLIWHLEVTASPCKQIRMQVWTLNDAVGVLAVFQG